MNGHGQHNQHYVNPQDIHSSEKHTRMFYERLKYNWAIFPLTATICFVGRVAENFGRFQLPIRLFKRPVLGWMHGSFILINGAIENKVTWDTGCLAEGFWFAFHVCDLVTSTSKLLI